MKYYNYIEIDNFEVIQQKTLDFLVINDFLNTIGFSILPWKEYIEVCPELITAFDRYGIKPIATATYITTNQEQSPIHIDNLSHLRPLCRINIPILNCAGSKTEFYKVPLTEFDHFIQKNKLDYYRIKETSSYATKVSEVEIIYPTVIRTQEPHRVNTNMNTVPRVCMSLTMDKDPVFLLEDDCAFNR